MRFQDFCALHGLIIDAVTPGRWVRVPTTDHPRKRNGAYKYLGDIGWVQNHAQSTEVSTWRPDADAPKIDHAGIAAKARQFEHRMMQGWQSAAETAATLIQTATVGEHNYLHAKSLGHVRGFVLQKGALLVPMRHWDTNRVQGAQVIRWLADERRYEKKMLPGMRAKGAVFRIGSQRARRTWLVEGYATGLSLECALATLRLQDAVVVCFSASNLIHVSSMLSGEVLVFADNDESGAGERAAIATGRRYCMSGTVGHDANDMHINEGIFRVASLMMDATASEAPM
jgi:phage/plasmid primase-like uncharacterized protein